MTTLTNSTAIDAPLEKIWTVLATVTDLARYDPAVRTAQLTTRHATGLGAARRVIMRDGKHWFEEQIATFEPNDRLAFELTACNFPIERLQHTYTFAVEGSRTTVTQVMDYTPTFGLLGRMFDRLALRRGFDAGVKKFLAGLKADME